MDCYTCFPDKPVRTLRPGFLPLAAETDIDAEAFLREAYSEEANKGLAQPMAAAVEMLKCFPAPERDLCSYRGNRVLTMELARLTAFGLAQSS
jgi:hypothetical protein